MQLIDRDIAKSSALVIDANPTARGLLAAQMRIHYKLYCALLLQGFGLPSPYERRLADDMSALVHFLFS